MKDKTPTIRETMFAQIADKMMFEQAKSYANAYMDEANRRRVFPDNEAIEKLTAFDEPLPQYPQLATEILKLLDEYGSPATLAQTERVTALPLQGNQLPSTEKDPATLPLRSGIGVSVNVRTFLYSRTIKTES